MSDIQDILYFQKNTLPKIIADSFLIYVFRISSDETTVREIKERANKIYDNIKGHELEYTQNFLKNQHKDYKWFSDFIQMIENSEMGERTIGDYANYLRSKQA